MRMKQSVSSTLRNDQCAENLKLGGHVRREGNLRIEDAWPDVAENVHITEAQAQSGGFMLLMLQSQEDIEPTGSPCSN